MIKAGDKIVFRRTEYGALETGVFVGERRVEPKHFGDVRCLYTVQLENGDKIEFNFRGSNMRDAKAYMCHHIGWVTVRKDFVHCERGYECAAWYENIQVKAGSRYPMWVTERDVYDKDRNLVEEELEQVYFCVDGVITSDEFGSRFGGVPISDYDNTKNAGKHSTHHISYYAYEVAGKMLALRGVEPCVSKSTYRSKDGHFSEDYDVELFDEVIAYVRHFEYNGEKLNTTVLALLRFERFGGGLQKALAEAGRHECVVFYGGKYQIEVERGDWKHDHGHLRYVVCDFFKGFGVDVVDLEDVTDEWGTDCYSSVHNFVLAAEAVKYGHQ